MYIICDCKINSNMKKEPKPTQPHCSLGRTSTPSRSYPGEKMVLVLLLSNKVFIAHRTCKHIGQRSV